MQVTREIRALGERPQVTVELPPSFAHQQVEIIVLTLDGASQPGRTLPAADPAYEAALDRLEERFAPLRHGPSLVDELIAERRREAQREAQE